MNGLELYELRKKYDVTQSELAEHLGYLTKGIPNRSMICRFENGHANINKRIEIAIKQYFKQVEVINE